MTTHRAARGVQRSAAVVAVLFGLVTLYAGGRVLLGSDPGYIVFQPLLVFNTIMGLAYVAAGLLIWREVRRGLYASGAIFLLNLIVLVGIVLVYRNGGNVAVDSLRAMSFRTVVWLVLLVTVFWLTRKSDQIGGLQ